MSLPKNKSFIDDLSIRYEFTVTFSISLAVFLFILFFQPFDTDQFNLNDTVLFLAGFGGINFVFMFGFLSLIPRIKNISFLDDDIESGPGNLSLTFVLVLDTVAFAFYLHYVGLVSLSMYIMFKIILVCFTAVILLKAIYVNRNLNHQVSLMQLMINESREILKKLESDQNEDIVEIFSENRSEKVLVMVKDLIYLRSADNYVEIIHLVNDKAEKKLIRNTLKNMEYLLAKYQTFVRCHRSYIINLTYIEKLHNKSSGYHIKVVGTDAEVPVSRQYLLRLRDALEQSQV